MTQNISQSVKIVERLSKSVRLTAAEQSAVLEVAQAALCWRKERLRRLRSYRRHATLLNQPCSGVRE